MFSTAAEMDTDHPIAWATSPYLNLETFASNIDHPVYVNRAGRYSIFNLPAPRKNRGTELLATWRKAPFAATVSNSYVRASELDPGGTRQDMPLTPRHSLGIVGM